MYRTPVLNGDGEMGDGVSGVVLDIPEFRRDLVFSNGH